MGLKGSGKDTVAKMLPAEWKRMAFADTLKDIVSILFGWDRNLVEGNTEYSRKWREEVSTFWSKELDIKNFTPRLALQTLGTDVFRDHFNQDIWVKVLKHKIINSNDNIVITDVRFPNEANMIKELGGKIVQIIRGDLPEWWETAKELNNKHIYGPDDLEKWNQLKGVHPSEYSLIGVIEPDYIIHNDLDLDFLHKKVNDMIKFLYD
jgi:hypothetical protein